MLFIIKIYTFNSRVKFEEGTFYTFLTVITTILFLKESVPN